MIERWFEPFSLLEKTRTPDLMGGENMYFSPSLEFKAVVSLSSGTESVMAEQPVVAESFVLLHELDVMLSPGDHVRRERDGAVFRVDDCSDNLRAPAFSGLHFAQVPVERMVVPC